MYLNTSKMIMYSIVCDLQRNFRGNDKSNVEKHNFVTTDYTDNPLLLKLQNVNVHRKLESLKCTQTIVSSIGYLIASPK
jgi:hypothetical protein